MEEAQGADRAVVQSGQIIQGSVILRDCRALFHWWRWPEFTGDNVEEEPDQAGQSKDHQPESHEPLLLAHLVSPSGSN